MSSCDDARSREEIMTISARKAVACYGGSFSAVTYVGVGVWDCHAAQRLGWNFIGVGSGDTAQRLLDAGAATVLPGFQPSGAFFDAISNAAIRRQPSGT
jgi:hypothetical protein